MEKYEIELEIKSQQIFEEKKEEENNRCRGQIEYKPKETKLQFVKKYEEQTLNFDIIITENKVITKRNGQEMTFDLEKTTKSEMQTPYGNIKMYIKTNKIDIRKEENKIKQINLEYNINLENEIQYLNKINIKIEY